MKISGDFGHTDQLFCTYCFQSPDCTPGCREGSSWSASGMTTPESTWKEIDEVIFYSKLGTMPGEAAPALWLTARNLGEVWNKSVLTYATYNSELGSLKTSQKRTVWTLWTARPILRHAHLGRWGSLCKIYSIISPLKIWSSVPWLSPARRIVKTPIKNAATLGTNIFHSITYTKALSANRLLR